MSKSKILLKTRQQYNSKRDQIDMNKCSGRSRICKVGSIPMGVINLLCGMIFAENCMNMKKLEWEGAHIPRAP